MAFLTSTYMASGMFVILLGIINLLLVGLVIYNIRKYKMKIRIMGVALTVMIVLELLFITFPGNWINNIGRTDAINSNYLIVSKTILMICLLFVSTVIGLVFIFAEFWKREHPRHAILRLKRDKKNGRIIKVTRVDGIPVNVTKDFFSLWNKALIAAGEHELTLQEIARSVKSFNDIVIFEEKVKQNWLAGKYSITVDSSQPRHFEIMKVNDK